MSKKLYVFGITSALGGIENLMHYLLTYFYKNKYFDKIIIVSPYKAIQFEQEYINHHIDIIHIPHRTHSIKYKKAIKDILKNVKDEDLIYINLSTFCNWLLLNLLKRISCKKIVHGHNAHVRNPLKKIIHFLGRIRFRNIGYTIAVSEECSKFMFNKKCDAIINNGIDSEKYHFNISARKTIRGELGILSSNLIVGCVGRISAEKNQMYVVELAKSYPDIIFMFLGDFMSGSYKNKVLHRSTPNCLFVGAKTNVNDFLSAMDAIVLPSKREAFPLVAAEAFSNDLLLFCHNDLKNRLPKSIVSCTKFHPIIDDKLDFDLIQKANISRNNNQFEVDESFDISVFLGRISEVIKKEVYHEE